MAQMPVLEELDLFFTLEGPEWITSLLKQSCCSPSLKILRINVPDRSPRGESIEAMADAFLKRYPSPQLKELSIQCTLDQPAGVVLGRVLQHPSSVMQELYLQMGQYEYAIPIARVLHKNARLKWFELRVWKGRDKTPLFKAYEEMLLHKTTIEQLVIDSGGRYSLNATIEFCLLLNRAGRRRLVTADDEMARKEWVDLFDSSQK